MSSLAVRQTVPVTETQWERLYRLVEQRRVHLDLTLTGVQTIGGPSPKWIQKLRHMSGQPTPRMRASMVDLDRALRWPVGTSWGLVADDRSGWTADILEDEETQLIEQTDEADHFGFVVAARLRAIPEPDRTAAMRRVLEVLEVRP